MPKHTYLQKIGIVPDKLQDWEECDERLEANINKLQEKIRSNCGVVGFVKLYNKLLDLERKALVAKEEVKD